MDVEALKALKPHEFEEAALGYRSSSDMASQAKDALEQRIISQMQKALQGETVDAAIGQLRELTKDFHYIQVECGLISTALNAFASDVRPAKTKLERALSDADGHRFTVGADGSVAYPAAGQNPGGLPPGPGSASGTLSDQARAIQRQAGAFDPNPNYAIAQDIANRIAEALKEATEADQKWAPELRRLKADDDLTVSDGDWADAQKDMEGVRTDAQGYLSHIKGPPKDGDGEDNAAWWKGLSDQERSDYVAMYPASAGALNGLPATVRDEANRMVLAEKHGEYTTRLQAIPPEPSPKMKLMGAYGMIYTDEWTSWNKKYGDDRKHLQNVLKGMDAIQSRFDSTGNNGLPEAYLLGFDPEANSHDGRVILATGNPDTAAHTAVYVPGTGTHLENIAKDLGRGEALWGATQQFAQGKPVSTITWFDYDAPRSAKPMEKGDLFPEAMFDSRAAGGGPILRDFLDGNRAAHQAAGEGPGHTTVIGHSFGSTLVGDAAKSVHWPQGSLAADDVIAVGSPGMQARRAADLGIQHGHMWAESAGGNDVAVREGGRYLAGLGDDWVIPTDPEFGANIMKSDAADHGAYWDDNSESLRNQAAVIAGRYNKVTYD
ncbi:alpha/beta hydrolase [Streptomyces sp. HUAS TT7]|uniref:alpha/beta hydrolase n=1 Tax=Streptomyces sp. HUAS TT7 TaxID=3447507 RepID=UPI003F65744A